MKRSTAEQNEAREGDGVKAADGRLRLFGNSVTEAAMHYRRSMDSL